MVQRLVTRVLGGNTPPSRNPATGLTAAQMQARQADERTWALRVLALMDTTGCSARDALKAIEYTDREARQ